MAKPSATPTEARVSSLPNRVNAVSTELKHRRKRARPARRDPPAANPATSQVVWPRWQSADSGAVSLAFPPLLYKYCTYFCPPIKLKPLSLPLSSPDRTDDTSGVKAPTANHLPTLSLIRQRFDGTITSGLVCHLSIPALFAVQATCQLDPRLPKTEMAPAGRQCGLFMPLFFLSPLSFSPAKQERKKEKKKIPSSAPFRPQARNGKTGDQHPRPRSTPDAQGVRWRAGQGSSLLWIAGDGMPGRLSDGSSLFRRWHIRRPKKKKKKSFRS